MKKIISIDKYGSKKWIIKFQDTSKFVDDSEIEPFLNYANNWNLQNPYDKVLMKYKMRDSDGNLSIENLIRQNTTLLQKHSLRDIDDDSLEFNQALLDLKIFCEISSDLMARKIKKLSQAIAKSEKLVTDKKITVDEISSLKTITSATNIFHDAQKKVSSECDAVLNEWEKTFNAVFDGVVW